MYFPVAFILVTTRESKFGLSPLPDLPRFDASFVGLILFLLSLR